MEIGEIPGLVGTVDISFTCRWSTVASGVTRGQPRLRRRPASPPRRPMTRHASTQRTDHHAGGCGPGARCVQGRSAAGGCGPKTASQPGDTLLYQVSITNIGNQEAVDVVFDGHARRIHQPYCRHGPDKLRCRSRAATTRPTHAPTWWWQPPAGGDGDDLVSCTQPDPAAGVKQVANQGTVAAANHGDIVTDDPDTSTVDDPTVTQLVAEPNLIVTKRDLLLIDSGGDSVVSPGDTLLYQVILLNSGNAAAQNVLFSDTPDANAPLVAGTVQATGGEIFKGNGTGDGSVDLRISELPAGTSIIIAFQVRVINPLPAGVTQVANQGITQPAGGSTVLTDDPDTPLVGDPTITPVSPPLVIIAKDATPTLGANVHPGDVIEYRLRVTNQGQTTLNNLVVRDPVPDDTVYEGSDSVPAPTLEDNVLVWQIGTRWRVGARCS
ncbi:MAG: DUF11 domain-containing protein [Caldilineaceae bacterium]